MNSLQNGGKKDNVLAHHSYQSPGYGLVRHRVELFDSHHPSLFHKVRKQSIYVLLSLIAGGGDGGEM